MAVNINVPSQVKTYANLASFPASGALKTIYIAEDTNKTYRWTGSVYVEVSAAGASGITIGTTAITSGTVGRVLFEGTGNVVQESANLFWNNTNSRLGIGTATPTQTLDVNGQSVFRDALTISNGGDRGTLSWGGGTFYIQSLGTQDMSLVIPSGAKPLIIKATTGNLLINTTTDAGFRLDVNGTARVQNTATIVGTNPFLFINNNSTGLMGVGFQNAGTDQAYTGIASAAGAGIVGSLTHDYFIRSLGRRILFTTTGSAIQAMLFSTGNFAINTTTDAGFRLDVNGTARFNGNLTFQTTSWILDNSNAIMHRGGFNVESIAFNLSRMVFTDNNGFVFNGSSSAATLTASSIVDIQSTTRGFLPPRMTTTQKNAIATPATGLMVYDNVLNRPCFYDGTTWITL